MVALQLLGKLVRPRRDIKMFKKNKQLLRRTSQNDVTCTNKMIIVEFYECPEHMLDYPLFFCYQTNHLSLN